VACHRPAAIRGRAIIASLTLLKQGSDNIAVRGELPSTNCKLVSFNGAFRAVEARLYAISPKPFVLYRELDMLKSIESAPVCELLADAAEKQAKPAKSSPARLFYQLYYSFRYNMHIIRKKNAQH
jgi:hypothetical protein